MAQVCGYLLGATKKNKISFYAPDGTFIEDTYTAPNGQFVITLEFEQYRIMINDKGWAASPDPLTVYLPLQIVTITASCVNQCDYSREGRDVEPFFIYNSMELERNHGGPPVQAVRGRAQYPTDADDVYYGLISVAPIPGMRPLTPPGQDDPEDY